MVNNAPIKTNNSKYNYPERKVLFSIHSDNNAKHVTFISLFYIVWLVMLGTPFLSLANDFHESLDLHN